MREPTLKEILHDPKKSLIKLFFTTSRDDITLVKKLAKEIGCKPIMSRVSAVIIVHSNELLLDDTLLQVSTKVGAPLIIAENQPPKDFNYSNPTAIHGTFKETLKTIFIKKLDGELMCEIKTEEIIALEISSSSSNSNSNIKISTTIIKGEEGKSHTEISFTSLEDVIKELRSILDNKVGKIIPKKRNRSKK